MQTNRIQPDQLTYTSAKRQAAEIKNEVSRGEPLLNRPEDPHQVLDTSSNSV